MNLIRGFLENDKYSSKTNNTNSLINGSNQKLKSISIATATIYDKNGGVTHYLSVSGKSWSGTAPNKITINNKEYIIIRDDNEILPNRNRVTNTGNSTQTNFNHAEKKLMGFITELNQKNSNISHIDMKIQNTDENYKGACTACGGKDGYGGTIGDFHKKNMNIKINIEHGSVHK